MSVDFLRAWQISASVPINNHATLCSYRQTKDPKVFYLKDGIVGYEPTEKKGKE